MRVIRFDALEIENFEIRVLDVFFRYFLTNRFIISSTC